MINIKDTKSRITEYMDSPSSRYLYYVPIIGGIKCYRTTKQIKLLEKTKERSQTDYLSKLYEITPGYKAGTLELAKILSSIVLIHGLIYGNIYGNNVETLLSLVGYLFSSHLQEP